MLGSVERSVFVRVASKQIVIFLISFFMLAIIGNRHSDIRSQRQQVDGIQDSFAVMAQMSRVRESPVSMVITSTDSTFLSGKGFVHS